MSLEIGRYSKTTLQTICLLTLILITNAFPATLHGKDANPDSLHLSLNQAETLFLERNIVLMAEKLQIDVKEAEVRQARLWHNPEIGVEHQIINRDRSGPIGFTGTDNTVFEIEQLISTAGKRGRTVQLLELEKSQAKHQFDILLREFKRLLRQEFFQLAYLNRIEGLYQEQIDALERILLSFEEQHEQGNIAQTEIIRIRGLLLEIEQEYSSVLSEQLESQNALTVLLQLDSQIPVPELPDDIASTTIQLTNLELSDLNEIAMASRSDLLTVRSASDVARQQLRVERAGAFPDIGIGLVYDKLDGPIDNYFGVTLNVEIPLWNRNQGNIQAARHQIRQAELSLTHQEQGVINDVESSLARYNRSLHLLGRTDSSYEQDFSIILEAILTQYQEGEIRLFEFIDYYESFREGIIRNYTIKEEFLRAAEELNFSVGTDVFQFNF